MSHFADKVEPVIGGKPNNTQRVYTTFDEESIKGELNQRYELIKFSLNEMQGIYSSLNIDCNDEEKQKELLNLVAADVFVEKATYHITKRAGRCFWLSIVCGFAALFIVFLFFYINDTHFYILDAQKKLELYRIEIDIYNKMEAGAIAVVILKKLALSTIFFGGIYFFAAMGHGFICEWAGLMSRRHSLRMGRLAIYLRKGDVPIEKLREVFDFSIVSSSSFRKVNADTLGKGVLGQIGELSTKIADSIVAVIKSKN